MDWDIVCCWMDGWYKWLSPVFPQVINRRYYWHVSIVRYDAILESWRGRPIKSRHNLLARWFFKNCKLTKFYDTTTPQHARKPRSTTLSRTYHISCSIYSFGVVTGKSLDNRDYYLMSPNPNPNPNPNPIKNAERDPNWEASPQTPLSTQT